MAFDGLRPQRLIVVVGTRTEIGKTWVSARLLRDLRANGFDVAARKPVQSFEFDDALTDAHFLADATGETPNEVCPHHRWYPVAMAPPMAAEALARPSFSVEDLVSEIQWPLPAPDIAFVEGVGGVRSPMAADGDAITLIELLQPDIVILVADARLGTINEVTLSLEAINSGAHVATPIVVLNQFDPADDLHQRNREWLASHLDVEVLSSVPAVVARITPT
ncbi:MAG: dethiobiotin synthase [Acidimicrobiales bacterium]